MINIRKNTFETNSSSSHSLVITDTNNGHYTPEEALKELHWMRDGIWSPWDDMYFGRSPFQVLYTFKDKLRYAYACAPTRVSGPDKNGHYTYSREFYKVTDVVKKFIPEFKGVDFGKKSDRHIGTDDCLLPQWLKKLNMPLIEFLTNKNVIVICDGDEYQIWSDMKKLGVINTEKIKVAIPEKEWWEELEEEGE